MKLYDTLEKQLKKEPNYVTDGGELKKWVVINKAQNYDAELISLLLDDKELKAKFFLDIKGALVFNQSLFIQFLEQKNYLNDSYTAYKNKVGLNIDGKYLKQRNEVALVWPFKDCVLEGGQSREEDEREEIFFNETLAQDEITQLFEPKVLTNVKRFNRKGENPFDKFKRNEQGIITDNLLIKGNNLLALHTLKEEFAGQVKLIYLDPPYNTENGGFNYNDSFSHSSWMTYMKNRLEISFTLLSEDGILLINSDEIEHSYLKILADDIFGRENFKGDFIWQKRKGGGNDSYFLALDHDYIIVQTKNGSKKIHKEWRMPYAKEYLKRYKETDENNLKYYWDTLSRDGLQNPIVVKIKTPDKSTITINSQKPLQTIKDELKSGHVKFVKTKNGWSLHHRVYMPEGKVARSILTDVGTNKTAKDELVALFGESIFKYPKPETLLSFLISLFTNEGDLVLDFFVGSGTTAAAALKMKRRFIACEQMDYINTVTVERLKKVITGEQGGISNEFIWQGGGEFIYLELKKYNQDFIEQIESAKDTKTILKIWNDMKDKSFLNYNVDLKKQEAHIAEFKALTLKEQKKHLVELLDKNQLYVNLTSLNDKNFAVSAEEKKATKDFYQLKSK